MLFLLTYKFRMSSQKIDILNHEMIKDFVKACWPNSLCQLMIKHFGMNAKRVDLLKKGLPIIIRLVYSLVYLSFSCLKINILE